MLRMEIDTSDLKRVIMRMPPVVKEEVGDALDHASRKFLKTFGQKRLQAPPWFQSSPSQGVVKNRAGFFRGFKRIFTFGQKGMGVTVFTESKLAKRQEKGGSVAGGRFGVPVPLSFAGRSVMTAKGRIKKSLWNLDRKKNIRPIKRNGKVFLMRVFKGSRTIEPLFVMKPRVEIEPRLEFEGTFDDMKPLLYSIIAKRLVKGLQRHWNG